MDADTFSKYWANGWKVFVQMNGSDTMPPPAKRMRTVEQTPESRAEKLIDELFLLCSTLPSTRDLQQLEKANAVGASLRGLVGEVNSAVAARIGRLLYDLHQIDHMLKPKKEVPQTRASPPSDDDDDDDYEVTSEETPAKVQVASVQHNESVSSVGSEKKRPPAPARVASSSSDDDDDEDDEAVQELSAKEKKLIADTASITDEFRLENDLNRFTLRHLRKIKRDMVSSPIARRGRGNGYSDEEISFLRQWCQDHAVHNWDDCLAAGSDKGLFVGRKVRALREKASRLKLRTRFSISKSFLSPRPPVPKCTNSAVNMVMVSWARTHDAFYNINKNISVGDIASGVLALCDPCMHFVHVNALDADTSKYSTVISCNDNLGGKAGVVIHFKTIAELASHVREHCSNTLTAIMQEFVDKEFPFTYVAGCSRSPMAIVYSSLLEACAVMFFIYAEMFPEDNAADVAKKVNTLLAKNGILNASEDPPPGVFEQFDEEFGKVSIQ